jgi:hypothetical protein
MNEKEFSNFGLFIKEIMPYPTFKLLSIVPLFCMLASFRNDTWEPSNLPGTYNDTTISLFGSSNYKLTLHIFNKEEHDEDNNNAIVTLTKNVNGKTTLLLLDSLFCIRPSIQLKDFNNDRIKDVLIYHSSDVRSNEMYYLYLLNYKLKKLTLVKGFEEIRNPEPDTTNNIITSFAVSGTDYYSFYRIDKKNKLINLNKSFDSRYDDSDSVNYKKVMREIRRMKE